MKYYQTSKFPKFIGSFGFYTLLACLLIGIGVGSWFAVSKSQNIEKAKNQPDKKENSSQYEKAKKPEISYEEPTPPIESAANSVEEVPYQEETKAPAEEIKPNFNLPVEGNISKGYSDSALQFSATYGDMRLHTGIDILCEKNSEIKAMCTGNVVSVEELADLGKTVSIDHGNGITVKYCGIDGITVKSGDTVNSGTVIGYCGDIPAESSEQSHIHIECYKDGEKTSPLAVLGLE